MPSQDLAKRGRDGPLREDARGELVQQRLERMVIGAVEQLDLHIHAPQEPGRKEAPEAAAHDHDAVALCRCAVTRCGRRPGARRLRVSALTSRVHHTPLRLGNARRR